MDKEETTILYKYGRYVVIAIDNHVAENGQVKDAYALYNTETDVIEFEHTMLWNVVQWAIKSEHALKDLLARTPEQNDKNNSWPEAVEADESLKPKPH